MDCIISESQSAFVPSRLITDNVLISSEIMHYMKRKKQGKHSVAAFKLDMSKAYEIVEWTYLEAMMRKMGFDEDWIKLMMHCVSSVSYSVARDSTTVGPIVPSRGLRQGDPLSPYLFLLCAKGLSVLIRNMKRSGFLHGARVVNGAPVVSHLFFVDDCFLFFQANTEEARIIKSILAIYGAASGQRVNFNKSSISFSGNTRADSIASVCNILEVNATTDYGMYLGLPSAVGRNKFEAFRFINDRVWHRLEN